MSNVVEDYLPYIEHGFSDFGRDFAGVQIGQAVISGETKWQDSNGVLTYDLLDADGSEIDILLHPIYFNSRPVTNIYTEGSDLYDRSRACTTSDGGYWVGEYTASIIHRFDINDVHLGQFSVPTVARAISYISDTDFFIAEDYTTTSEIRHYMDFVTRILIFSVPFLATSLAVVGQTFYIVSNNDRTEVREFNDQGVDLGVVYTYTGLGVISGLQLYDGFIWVSISTGLVTKMTIGFVETGISFKAPSENRGPIFDMNGDYKGGITGNFIRLTYIRDEAYTPTLPDEGGSPFPYKIVADLTGGT